MRLARRLGLLAPLLFALSAVAAPRGQAVRPRTFSTQVGPNDNHFLQTRDLTMHAVVRGGEAPRVLFATPAGNSGVGLWFRPVAGKGLEVERTLRPVESEGMKGSAIALRGPGSLELERVMLDSVRALRDKDHGAEGAREAEVRRALEALRGAKGPAATTAVERLATWLEPKLVSDPRRPGALILEREALGSGARYRVELVPRPGTRIVKQGDTVRITAASGESRFEVRSFVDRAPLTPVSRILEDGGQTRQERNLQMLVYRDKFLAGSYQYQTYFGRDTLITARLLGGRATPEVLGTAVGSVLDRVSPHGRVAHEESNGDQATLEALPKLVRRVRGGAPITKDMLARLEKPIHDYKMMDGEFLLPSLLVDYLGRATPAEARRTLSPARIDALARVLVRIAESTDKWAAGDGTSALVHLRRGQIVGNWRDSGEGLGDGRTPLDVNAYLVPAALKATAELLDHPGLDRQALMARVTALRPSAVTLLSSRQALAARRAAWDRAVDKFEVALDAKRARTRLARYLETFSPEERATIGAQKLWSGVSVAEALAGKPAPELDGGVRFPGLSLDRQGKPTPVYSSDEAFHFFYGEPTRQQLLDGVTRMFQPFPVGLMTPVGMVTANAAYSDRPGDHTLFDRDHYHGAVVWSWPQNMVRQGLEKQLARHEDDPEVRAVLGRALRELEVVQKNLGAVNGSELWSWRIAGKAFLPQPFGASAAHKTEGTAIQLWSNTYE